MMTRGRCLSATLMRSNISMSLVVLRMSVLVNPDRVVPAIQFSCGRLISLVSSMETILYDGGTKRERAFSIVVLPEAVPPQKRMLHPFSMVSQKYAARSREMVWLLSRSMGVSG